MQREGGITNRRTMSDKERNGPKLVPRVFFILAQNTVTCYPASIAGVVELVDTRDLKSLGP